MRHPKNRNGLKIIYLKTVYFSALSKYISLNWLSLREFFLCEFRFLKKNGHICVMYGLMGQNEGGMKFFLGR